MSIIMCPECGHEVSEKADICLYCGFSIKKYTKNNKKAKRKFFSTKRKELFYKIVNKRTLITFGVIFSSILLVVIINAYLRLRIPNFVGLNINEATEILSDRGIVYNLEENYTYDFSAGTIYEQSVSPNSIIYNSNPIVLKVSKGRILTVPNIIGKKISDVSNELEEIAYTVEYVYTETSERGTVLSLSKEAGTTFNEGESLIITASAGMYTYLPDLKEKNVNEVKEILNEYRVNYTIIEKWSDYEKDIVYNYYPLKFGDSSDIITIYVSKGVGKDIPRVIDTSINSAENLLNKVNVIPAWNYVYENMTIRDCTKIQDGEIVAQEYEDMVDASIESMRVDINKQSITLNQINFNKNSVGGVDTYISFKNVSDKQIAYITFKVCFYDRMGYRASCSIQNKSIFYLKYTGPLNSGSSMNNVYWQAVIYNYSVSAVKPLSAIVEFTDGSKQELTFTNNFWYYNDYYGGELKN